MGGLLKTSDAQLGNNLDFGTVLAAKGVGRVTILLFAVAYTYSHINACWGEGEEEEFGRCLARFAVFSSCFWTHFIWQGVALNENRTLFLENMGSPTLGLNGLWATLCPGRTLAKTISVDP